MPDGWSAAAQALSRMGESIADTSSAFLKIDARQKADAAELEIAGRIEAFKRSLLSDPNHGTPGQQDGYMKRWQDEVSAIDQMIQEIDNPLARRAVQDTFGRLKASQTTAIYGLQFEQWGKGVVAQRGEMIRQRAETSGLPVQQLLEETAADLDFLVGSNLIDRATRDKELASWSQVIMEKDVTDRAKAAYAAGGLSEAKKAILSDEATYTAGGSPFRASDEVKQRATLAIERLDEIVNDEADTDMQAAWSRMVAAERYGTAPNGPILTVDFVQNWTTKEGLSPSAKTKEYWINRLSSFSNGKETGTGTKASDLADLWMGQAEKMAGALRRAKGGVLAADAAVSVVDPVTGKVIARGVNRDVLDALAKNPDFVAAMDASGKWDKWNALLDSLNKPAGAVDTIRDNLKKELAGKPGEAALLAEFDAFANGAGSSLVPEKLEAWVKEKITGKAYNVKLGQLVFGSFTGNRYKDGVDLFAQDIMDGKFDGLVVRDSQGRGKITNPLFAEAYNGALAEIQGGLARLGIQVGAPAISDSAAPWFEGKVADAKDLPKTRPATQAERTASPMSRYSSVPLADVLLKDPASIAYTLVPVTDKRDARILRDVAYPDGYHVRQTLETDGKTSRWVDVVPALTGKGGYWVYADPEVMDEIKKAQAKPEYFGVPVP